MFVELKKVTDNISLDKLSEKQIEEIQISLDTLGYPIGKIDGFIGPKTKNAWAEFKADVFQNSPDLIGPASINILEEKLNEFVSKKEYNFSTINNTIESIKSECILQGLSLKPQIAYILATINWETNHTFKTVKEAYWKSEEWRKQNLKYYPYYGRGFVQLTWKSNYEKYSKILNKDLVNNPDLSMDPNISLFITVHGFKTGAFTGRKLTEYINNEKIDFLNARRCINGTDQAYNISILAEKYLKEL